MSDDIERTDSGRGMLSFDNSPEMQEAEARQKAQVEKEKMVKEEYAREMENIAQHGPLDRTTETIMSEEEQEIADLIENEDHEGLKEVVRSKLEDIGAVYEDFQTLDYFEKFSGSSNPAVREYASQMSLLTIRLLKAMREDTH